jgi:MFS family permease
LDVLTCTYAHFFSFLGVVEAPYYPGAIYIISQFYTRTEVATRIAILYTGNILATAFAGLIAAGIFQLDGVNGLAGWRWLFIIQGAATGVVALLALPFLPDTPLTTRWLNAEERQLAHERLFRDRVDIEEKGSTFAGLKQAVKDPRVWLFCLAQNLHLVCFFPTPKLVDTNVSSPPTVSRTSSLQSLGLSACLPS